MRWTTVGLIALSSLIGSELRADESPSVDAITEFVRQIEPRVATGAGTDSLVSPDELRGMLGRDIRRRRQRVNEQDVHAWREFDSLEEWDAFKRARLDALRRSLGEFPKPPENLHVRVTRTVRGDGYSIDCIVFESRPGLPVTANLYRPAKALKSMPGILICHSHHNPKTQGELQDMGMNWARSGCLVLIMDQLGHGERRQHPFRSAKDFDGEFRISRQDYHFRYNVGMQLHLIGDSLIGWMVWDLQRGVDLLLDQPGVDPERIVLLGAVAGGGDPCAVAAALDPRIKAAVPFNFGGPQPESVYPLPKDAALSFNYVGGGSWESTRNLKLSARDGFLPWVVVGSIAPRRLIYAHEFSWDREKDPVWQRLESIYRWHGVPQRLASLHGFGRVQLSSGQASHCNNIGAHHRRQIYPVFQQWFGIAAPDPEYSDRRDPSMLYCVEGIESARDIRLTQVHQLADQIAERRITQFCRQLDQLPAAKRRVWLRDAWAKVLGFTPPGRLTGDLMRTETRGPIRVIKMTGRADRFTIPLIVLIPREIPDAGCSCVIAVAQGGKAGFLKHRSREIAELLATGISVCLPDLPGCGETSPGSARGRRSSATGISSSRLMLGGTIVGDRLRDLLAVVDWLRTLDDVDADRIAIWGDSFAPVNPTGRNIAVPIGIDKEPQLAEPMGPLLSLYVPIFDTRIQAVLARRGLVSFRSILGSQFVYIPHDLIIPEALTTGDLVDLAAAVVPIPVRLEEFIDGTNRQADAATIRRDWSRLPATNQRVDLAESSANNISWLIGALNRNK